MPDRTESRATGAAACPAGCRECNGQPCPAYEACARKAKEDEMPRESPDPARSVIRAISDLHQRRGEWPTAADIATELRLDEATVGRALKRLKTSRIMQARTVKRRRVWMPWGQG